MWLSAFALFAIGSALFLTSGCAERKKPHFAWTVAARVRPILPPTASDSPDTLQEPAPDVRTDLGELNVRPLPSRIVPARPHVPVTASKNTETENSEPPLIIPQLSAQDAANAQQQTNTSLSIAERNLASIQGKALNASQSDLVSKIKGFVSDAREAGRSGDWTRARSLARKAQALSEELAGSS
jgi:hypothetical protein